MAVQQDWLEVTLDTNTRRGLADAVEATSDPGTDESIALRRMLRSSRNELLIDQAQAKLVLAALDGGGQLSALQARLDAFLRAR
jgi:hypothetical protein